MYFMNFQVLGEVVETLIVSHPDRRLLVDIMVDNPNGDSINSSLDATRTCFSVMEEDLINAFEKTVSVGDIVRAEGTFFQSNYVPHKTSYIDTTFKMQSFWKVELGLPNLQHDDRLFDVPQTPHLH